jgi:hypothetical protein
MTILSHRVEGVHDLVDLALDRNLVFRDEVSEYFRDVLHIGRCEDVSEVETEFKRGLDRVVAGSFDEEEELAKLFKVEFLS